jgi:hypothetical protein
LKSFDYDLRYLKAGVEELESYLLSEHLFWPLDAKTEANEPVFPNLTLGNLLLIEARLKARHKTLEQEVQLGAVLPKLEQVRSQWRAAWDKKAEHSLHNRVTMWRNFIDDYTKAPEANADRYAYEVQRRVMLELLKDEVDQVPPAVSDLIAHLDALLKTFLISGDFIWESELKDGFPMETYWYLYGKLPNELKQSGDY